MPVMEDDTSTSTGLVQEVANNINSIMCSNGLGLTTRGTNANLRPLLGVMNPIGSDVLVVTLSDHEQSPSTARILNATLNELGFQVTRVAAGPSDNERTFKLRVNPEASHELGVMRAEIRHSNSEEMAEFKDSVRELVGKSNEIANRVSADGEKYMARPSITRTEMGDLTTQLSVIVPEGETQDLLSNIPRFENRDSKAAGEGYVKFTAQGAGAEALASYATMERESLKDNLKSTNLGAEEHGRG